MNKVLWKIILLFILSTTIINKVYSSTGFSEDSGVKIHNACLDLGVVKKKFLDVFDKGVWCLDSLDKELSKGKEKGFVSVPKRHILDIFKIAKARNLKILCRELPRGVEGRASNQGSPLRNYNGEGVDIEHPFISFALAYIKNSDTSEFSDTLFHELFHIMGYKHGVDIDYANACPQYCFAKKERVRNLAGKMCAMDDSNYDREEYLKTFISWSQASGAFPTSVVESIANYIKEEPQRKKWGFIHMVKAVEGKKRSLAAALSQTLRKNVTDLSYSEKKYLMQVENNNYPIKEASKSVAKALYSLYYEGDTKKTMAHIEKSFPLIKKGGNSYELGTVSNILYDINRTNNGYVADKAYDLYHELKN